MKHGMTRRQAHIARAAEAKVEKERRRKLHVENQLVASERRRAEAEARKIADLDSKNLPKDMKTLNISRALAVKSIPFWLGSNPRAFDQTMAALNLKNRISLSNTKRNKEGMLSEYRQLYIDSIPSFLESISAEDRPDELNVVLDKLSAVGFSDLQWAKNFRSVSNYHAQYEHYALCIESKRDRIKDRKLNLEKQQKEMDYLLELSQVYGNDSATGDGGDAADMPPTEKIELVGYFRKALAAVSNLFGIKQNPDIFSKSQRPTMTKLDHEILKQKERITKTVENIEATKKHIEKLEQQQKASAATISDEVYNAATQCIEEVLPVITMALAVHVNERHAAMIEQYQTLDAKTDLTKPHEWYLRARMDRRKIIFHGGPTNSGKTYNALLRLKEAKKGLYLGPLRLLAAEVYETLTSAGIYTSLFTGQEKRIVPFSTHAAATVEMAPTDSDFDIVVIDEIQMIADAYRGYAWTRAFLGIRCKEIHLCGGMEAEAIARKIAESCGDEFELHKYERFADLTIASASIAETSGSKGSYRNVQPGDCVVAFSKNDIFAIKREIEETTAHKCCVIYGTLPPETRTEQARRFNNPDSEYKVLVASDAIGMGLNLNIRRIIFNSIYKSDGEAIVRLDHSSIKQISGRAGRRNSPFPNGEVTCRDPKDLPYIRQMLSTEIAPVTKAGLLPTAPHIAMFSESLEKYGLSKDFDKLDKILVQFSDMATVKGDYFLCRQTPMKLIARYLRDLQISIEDKYTLTMAPVQSQNQESMAVLRKFAIKYAASQTAGLTVSMLPKPAKTFDDLSQLCSTYNELELFLWLHNRFPANANVVEQQSALAMKEKAIKYINKGLSDSETLKLDHCYITRDNRLRAHMSKTEKEKGMQVNDLYGEMPPSDELSDM